MRATPHAAVPPPGAYRSLLRSEGSSIGLYGREVPNLLAQRDDEQYIEYEANAELNVSVPLSQ